jgi:hypothetical protein
VLCAWMHQWCLYLWIITSSSFSLYFNGTVYLLFAVTIWRLKWSITLSHITYYSCSQSCSTRSSHRLVTSSYQ